MTAARIPLNTFAIGFGLAGLAELWTTAGDVLRLPADIGTAFWVVATVAWLWLIVAHLVRGIRSGQPLADQLRHPAQGPIVALVPTTGMLVAGELLTFAHPVGLVLFAVSAAAAAVFAGWLVGRWLQGGLVIDAVHGGYLLPTVAAGFVAANVAARAGLPLLGWGAFGVGGFFWVLMTTLLVLRLAIRPALPDPLVPTMAILVAPPALSGLAWFELSGDRLDAAAAAFAGLGVLLLLVQLALFGRYRRLTFSLGFWSFTFPAAGVAADALTWLRLTGFAGWQVVAALLLAAITVLVGAIAGWSLRDVVRAGRRAAEATLTEADATDAHA